MKADAKKVLIAMIDKAANNSASELIIEKENERIESVRKAAFLKALFATPAAYLQANEYDHDISDIDGLNLNKAGERLRESIVKANPTREDEQTEYVTFNALSHTCRVTKAQVKKFAKLAEEIDVAVVSGEAVDLYNLLKKALN